MSVRISDFEKDGKKFPTIGLKNEDERFFFTFGLKKARLILRHMDDIKKFVDECERTESVLG